MFGISQSVRSRAVQVCTPELFHQATRSSRVKDVCAQIEDALERKRRGEICQEDYDTMKTQLKSQLPILTPHATFKNGRRLNADAIPSGLSIYDKDHIPDPRGYWEEKKKVLAQKKISIDGKERSHSDEPASMLSVLDLIVLVHVTPSMEGLRLVFVIPDGMDLATAQRWMSEQLEDAEYDVCVKDLARPSFIVPEDYILYINETELFKNRSISSNNSTSSNNGTLSNNGTSLKKSNNKNQNYVETNRPSGNSGNPAVPLGSPAEHAQSAAHATSAVHHLSSNGSNQNGSKPLKESGFTPAQKSGDGFDAPPTIERSGSERRVGAVTPLPPEEERGLGIGGGALLARRDGEVEKKSPSEEVLSEERRALESEERREKSEELYGLSQAEASMSQAEASMSQASEQGKRVGGEAFPSEYDGLPYDAIVEKLVELLGGEPQHGSRNSFIFTLSCYLRYLCDDNRDWIKAVLPTFGEEKERAFATVDSACNRKQSHRMPTIVRKAISLCQDEQVRGRAANYDTDDFGDINNPESYFYRIHEMPQKLPKLIKLLISKTPKIYQPAVAQAVFPPLGAHLCDTRFRYIDNVEHEATLMSILCAPTGSGKESITQPINHIMADIRLRDAQQRERERAWKDECNSKGANKDKRDRPEGLVIQEVNIDMTNPAFVLRMKEAENHFLYAKVNELNLFDALKGKTNQHFRIMELAFDLGTYGQDRVGVQSVTETVKVRFNWNACCTPKKCRDYFRRVVTDGPVSRISFATIERRPCGSAMPIYGTYDAAFDEELKPYIDNLVKARGLVDCPQAMRLAKKLVEENAEFARLSQNYVFENLSFRANVIAYLKACILYVANGMKWEKSIEDFIRWSERYDLWCKLKLFGQMIYDADGEQDKVSRTAPNGPKNLLTLLPDEFSLEDYMKVRRAEGFDNDDRKRVKDAINQWVHRGYVVKMESADADTDSSIFRKLKFLKH